MKDNKYVSNRIHHTHHHMQRDLVNIKAGGCLADALLAHIYQKQQKEHPAPQPRASCAGAEILLSKWGGGGADFFFVQVTWARCGRGMCHLPYIVQKLKKKSFPKRPRLPAFS